MLIFLKSIAIEIINVEYTLHSWLHSIPFLNENQDPSFSWVRSWPDDTKALVKLNTQAGAMHKPPWQLNWVCEGRPTAGLDSKMYTNNMNENK